MRETRARARARFLSALSAVLARAGAELARSLRPARHSFFLLISFALYGAADVLAAMYENAARWKAMAAGRKLEVACLVLLYVAALLLTQARANAARRRRATPPPSLASSCAALPPSTRCTSAASCLRSPCAW